MMTRNDFEILARHLKAMYPEAPEYESPTGLELAEGLEESGYRDGYNTAINQVAGACRAVNNRFDADKFKAACGHECSHNKPTQTLHGLSYQDQRLLANANES